MYDYTEIDSVDFQVLKNLYNKAMEQGEDQFRFKGREILVNYAKYLIQYLEPKFEKES
jgi:hypothetical protein